MVVCAVFHFHGNLLTCVVFALLSLFSVAVLIKSEKNKTTGTETSCICLNCLTKICIWAPPEVIYLLPSIFFFNLPSCLFHRLTTCTSTVSHIFGNHHNFWFILLSVPESFCCVSHTGDALTAAGPLPTLKGSSVILEKLWTFFFPTLQKEVQSAHSFEYFFPSPFLNLWIHFRWGPGRLPRVPLLCSLAVCLTSFCVKSVKRRDFQEWSFS